MVEGVVYCGHFADKGDSGSVDILQTRPSQVLTILCGRLLWTAPILSIFWNIYRHVGSSVHFTVGCRPGFDSSSSQPKVLKFKKYRRGRP